VENVIEHSQPLALIIDDEIDICYLLSAVLRDKKLSAQSVFDLAQARNILQTVRPAIVFLDNHLTDGLGLEFIPYIKDISPQSKIVMITAYDDPASKQAAFSKGVDDFISKPLRRELINAAVDKLVYVTSATI
jgi:DNA-binding NtrC family response regulator